MKIKDKLNEIGRYYDVKENLVKIIESTNQTGTTPVDPYVDADRLWKNRIKYEIIHNQTKELFYLIESEKEIVVTDSFDLFELEQYLRTETNMLLRNYANSISHRHTPKEDMEYIRILLIIEYICTELHGYIYGDETDEYFLDLPKSWGREGELNGKVDSL